MSTTGYLGPSGPLDHEVVGRAGMVTVTVPGGEVPGEVSVLVRGTYETFVAYADEPLALGTGRPGLREQGAPGRRRHARPGRRAVLSRTTGTYPRPVRG